MGKKRKTRKRSSGKLAPGISLEKVVARIQQMMDPNSTVTHNEKLIDRVNIERQYDVVIRGRFAGQPVLGVIECKDHSVKKGPAAIEEFSKKTENLGANLRLIVSRKGFTKKALKLAKHEHIGCLSLLPSDPKMAGFSIGEWWYGVITEWQDMHLLVTFVDPTFAPGDFKPESVTYNGMPVVDWFLREFFTTYKDRRKEGDVELQVKFNEPRELDIAGDKRMVSALACRAKGVYQLKRKWIHWSGDAFYDWHANKMMIPNKGTIVGSTVDSVLSTWEDFPGPLPELNGKHDGFVRAVIYNTQKWDDKPVVDLSTL